MVNQALDLMVLAAGSFIGLVVLCLWLLAVSIGRSSDDPPLRRT